MNIVLYKPEIPPNTGNIARLCVSMQVGLCIIGKPSFDLTEKSVKRAGLDYWKYLSLSLHATWEDFQNSVSSNSQIFLISKFGKKLYTKAKYTSNDFLVFGNETSGLPKDLLNTYETTLKIPMKFKYSRCLNLSNSVAIVLFEAFRQMENW